MNMSSDTFFNRLTINPPPVLSYKLICEHPVEVARKLKRNLSTALTVLKSQSCLHNEAAILSRFIYRFSNRLRNDKGFRSMEKVNRGLLQYLNLEIVSIFEIVERQICDDFGPTRQLLEWLLVRLQGFCKLFDFIQMRCKETVSYLRWRFQTGHIWIYALVANGILSRIWAISQSLVRDGCNWYRSIFKYLPSLQPSMTPWLPDNCIILDDLEKWLGQPSYIRKSKPIVNELGFEKRNDDTREPSALSVVAMTEDLGVAISRESFDTDAITLIKKNKRNRKRKTKAK